MPEFKNRVLFIVILLLLLVSPVMGAACTPSSYYTLSGHIIMKFNQSGTVCSWTAPANATNVWYLVIAGGGGAGGPYGGGGGGAGGYVNGTTSVTPGAVYNLTVGAGGAGAQTSPGGNGGNSSFMNITATDGIQAIGGGGGSNTNLGNGKDGGSGGGASGNTVAKSGGISLGSQGYNGGGTVIYTPNQYAGGGGGGMGGAGANNPSGIQGGNGGNCKSFTITGSAVNYGGGGGGGVGIPTNNNTVYGSGACSIGGDGGTVYDGSFTTLHAPTSGANETGSGGGGNSRGGLSVKGGNGGTGIVIINYIPVIAPVASFTQSATSGAVGTSVNFNSTSANASSWLWEFGDGNTSTSENVSYTYYGVGNYTVTLTATNGVGSNSLTKRNTYTATLDPYVPLVNPGYEYGTGTLTPLNYVWQFVTDQKYTILGLGTDDPPVSTIGFNTTQHHSGSKSIVIDVSNSRVGTNATIYSHGSYGYSWGTAMIIEPNKEYNMTWWAKGDSLTSTSNLFYAFWGDGVLNWYNGGAGNTASGTYDWTQYSFKFTPNQTFFDMYFATYSKGRLYIDDVRVMKRLTPSASGNVTSGLVPLPVAFTGSATNGTASYYNWSFGDGTYSESQNPTHTYNSAGTFTVRFTAANGIGNENPTTMTLANTITASNPIPVAQFIQNVSSGSIPLNVKFYDMSTNSSTSWDWNFGDGTSHDITQNPTHQYINPGIYNVTLIATNAYGSGTVIDSQAVIVGNASNTNAGTKKLYLTFNGTSGSKNIVDYSLSGNSILNYGNASINTSQNKFGGASIYMDGSTISNLFVPFNKSLNFDGNNFYVGWWQNTTESTDTSVFSNRKNHPNNTLMTLGSYFHFGHMSSGVMNAFASSSTPPTNDIMNQEFMGNITCKTWDYYSVIRNGSSWQKWKNGILQNESSHSLSIANNTSAISIGSRQNDVSVNGFIDDFILYNGIALNGSIVPDRELISNPTASFTKSKSTGVAPLTIYFTNTSVGNQNVSTYIWNATNVTGNNTPFTFSTSASPTYTFGVGNWSITLNCTNQFGTSTTSQFVNVSSPIVASFTKNTSIGMLPLAVEFTDTSTGNPTGWSWYFGDEPYNNSWSQQNVSNSWAKRYGHGSISLKNGHIILFGGYNTITFYNDTWRSIDNGLTWTLLNSSSGWQPRYEFGTTVTNDGVIILTGGSGNRFFNDTWKSVDEGVTWIQVNSSSGWNSRSSHKLVTLVDNSIVLIGGFNASFKTNDTWKSIDYGETWVKQNDLPWLNRYNHEGVILHDGSIIILGGFNGTGTDNDVWRSTNNGTTWTQLNASAGWIDRGNFKSNVMPDNSIILFGGNNAAIGEFEDVWRSVDNGSTWVLINSTIDFGFRYSMSSNILSNGSILSMGGRSGGTNYNDTWIFDPSGSHDQNPIHTYTQIGNFSSILQAYNNENWNISTTQHVETGSIPISNFTQNQTNGTFPLAVMFNDTSQNFPTSWNWSFGDGTYSDSQNVTHVYYSGGNYTIILNVTNDFGNSNKTSYIDVWNLTVSGFSANETQGLHPFPVTFNVTIPNDNATIWNWSFGDGTWQNGTNQNASYIYLSSGTYSVILIASNPHASNTTTLTDYIIVHNHTQSGFVANNTIGALPLPVTFNVTLPDDNSTLWNWSFGDGTWQNGTDQNATHVYTTAGIYTVSEIASGTLDVNTTTLTDYITVHNQTSNSFTPNATYIFTAIPVAIQFTATSLNATWWNWSFGDGTWSNQTNGTLIVDHIYPQISRNYTVNLTTSEDGYGVFTSTHYVEIVYTLGVIFTANPMIGYAPLSVVFTDESTNSPTSWNWSFGDGQYSTLQNPTHIFTNAGEYQVILNASNIYGWGNYSLNISVGAVYPVASFTTSTTYGTAPLNVVFTDTSSTSGVTTWYWDFGDGNTSTDQNPSHTYVANGVYHVTLTVTDSIGTDTSGETLIYVSSSLLPLVDFVGNVTTLSAPPLAVQFTDLTHNINVSISEWNWSFGDGTYSGSQNPVHTYSLSGIYTVRLTVTNGTVSNYTIKNSYITIGVSSGSVFANFVATPTYSATTPATVQFTSTSVCTPACTNWAWDLDSDGAIDSNAENPSFTYTQSGNYSPRLVVSNGVGADTKIRSHYITIGSAFVPPTIPQPTATWNPSYNNGTQYNSDTGFVDLANSTYLKYWLQNLTATGNFSVYGFSLGIMAPIMHVFGFWIFLIIWGLYLFAVWIRSQDVTLPLIIGILSLGTFGLLFPKEALPVIIIMFVVCGAVIITKLAKE